MRVRCTGCGESGVQEVESKVYRKQRQQADKVCSVPARPVADDEENVSTVQEYDV